MARPGKSLAEKMAIIDAKIEKVSAQLAELREERKKLETVKQEMEYSDLIKLMKEKNVTVDQLKDLIQ